VRMRKSEKMVFWVSSAFEVWSTRKRSLRKAWHDYLTLLPRLIWGVQSKPWNRDQL
jgi:hypothetical protein